MSVVSASRGTVVALRISLQDIPPEGMRLACEVGSEDLQLAEHGPGLKDVLALTATVQVEASGFLVEGELNGLLVHECVRCLEACEASADVSFQARYQDPEKRGATGKGGRPVEEKSGPVEVDDYPMVAQHIDLQDVLREQIILSVPMQPLCSDDCRGLCQACGQNLNVKACGCEERKTESPFSVLQDVRQSSRNPLAS